MTRARRTDANHALIRTTLRQLGWIVMDTSRLGEGFADLVAYRAGVTHLIEVKSKRGTLTEDQQTLHAGVPVVILRTVEDCEALQ